MMRAFAVAVMSVFFLGLSATVAAGGVRDVIHASPELVQPLLPGMKAPDFTVRDVKGQPFQFTAKQMEKPLVLTFFRGGWCPYCNLHLSEMRFAEKQLREMGFDIWFVSMDQPKMLLASLEDPNIGYTIYSDADVHATRAFGVAYRVDDDTFNSLKSYDIDLEKASGNSQHVLPAPSTFIIGTDGVISFAYTNPNYKIRLAPAVLLAAAKSYQADADKRMLHGHRQASKK